MPERRTVREHRTVPEHRTVREHRTVPGHRATSMGLRQVTVPGHRATSMESGSQPSMGLIGSVDSVNDMSCRSGQWGQIFT